jgi:Amt family ammonium transporter
MVMTAISGGVSGRAGTLGAYLQADGRRQIDLSTTLNSILAGLVGITANCATVRLEGAFFIGIMSAVVYVFSVRLLNRYHIDDVVEAVSVR